MNDQWIVVPNWERFQHYRDRDPTWIKNYVALLSDDDYLSMTLSSRGVLHGIWTLYAATRGVLSTHHLRRVLCTNKGDSRHFLRTLELLNDAGWIEIAASKPLPYRYTRERDRDRGREDSPLPPSERGAVDNGRRASGTNPRAVEKQARRDHHDAMVEAARIMAPAWTERRTDLLHDRLDELETDHGATFTDQEREEIIDSVVLRG